MRIFVFLVMICVAGTASAQTTTGHTTHKANPLASYEYANEADAKRSCGADPVVWANLSSKALHVQGDKYYGKTKKGAYMCQSIATKNGWHLPKGKNSNL